MTTLHPDLIARAIIAAAISLGDDPATIGGANPSRRRRLLAASVYGLHHATQEPMRRLALVVGLDPKSIHANKRKGLEAYYRAAQEAEVAATAWLTARAASPVIAAPRVVPKHCGKPEAPSLPRRYGTAAAPVVIRINPVTPAIARRAHAMADLGVEVDALGVLFGVATDSLERAIKARCLR